VTGAITVMNMHVIYMTWMKKSVVTVIDVAMMTEQKSLKKYYLIILF